MSPRKGRTLPLAMASVSPHMFQYIPSCPDLLASRKDEMGSSQFFQKIRQHRNMWQNVLAWEDAFVGKVKETGYIPPQMLEDLLRDFCDVCYEFTGGADAEKARRENLKLQEKLFQNSLMYMRELSAHRESQRESPELKADELSYIYEPIQIFGEPWSTVLRAVVDERVKQIVTKGKGVSVESVLQFDDSDLQNRLSEEIQGHLETKRCYELADEEVRSLKAQAAALKQEAMELADKLRDTTNEQQLKMEQLQNRLDSLEISSIEDANEAALRSNLEENLENLQNLLELERENRYKLERQMRENELRMEAQLRKAEAEMEHYREASANVVVVHKDAPSEKNDALRDELAEALQRLEAAEQAERQSMESTDALRKELERRQHGVAEQKKLVDKYITELATQAALMGKLEAENKRLEIMIQELEARIEKMDEEAPEPSTGKEERIGKKYSGFTTKLERTFTGFSSGRVWTRLHDDAECKTKRLKSLQRDAQALKRAEIDRKERCSFVSAARWTKMPDDRRITVLGSCSDADEALQRIRSEFRQTHPMDDNHSRATESSQDDSFSEHSRSRSPHHRTVSPSHKVPRASHPVRHDDMQKSAADSSSHHEVGYHSDAGPREDECPGTVFRPSQNMSRAISRKIRGESRPASSTRGTISRPASSTGISRPVSSYGTVSRPISRCGPVSRPVSRRIKTPDKWEPIVTECDDDSDNPFVAFSHTPAETLCVEETPSPRPSKSASATALPSMGAKTSEEAKTPEMSRGRSMNVLRTPILTTKRAESGKTRGAARKMPVFGHRPGWS